MKQIFIFSLLFLAGCHLPIAHAFSDQVMPEELVARAASAPFIFPVFFVLAGIDIIFINPVIACTKIPEEISRAWNEDSEDPNQAKIIAGKIFFSPLYTLYLLGFIMFSEQFEKEKEENVIYLEESSPQENKK
ncbi:MAG: hypothetical protein AABZ60_15030 [Planctomycetota bacterium]